MSAAKKAVPDVAAQAEPRKPAAAASISSLVAMGAVVDAAPVAREIRFKLADGVEQSCTIHVRRMSVGDHEKYAKLAAASGDDERSIAAVIISNSITVGPNGEEVIPYRMAYQLHTAVANAMVDAVNEVNDEKKA